MFEDPTHMVKILSAELRHPPSSPLGRRHLTFQSFFIAFITAASKSGVFWLYSFLLKL